MEKKDKINELSVQLEAVIAKQEAFIKEIMTLRKELKALKGDEKIVEHVMKQEAKQEVESVSQNIETKTTKRQAVKSTIKQAKNSNLEKFIGENLISKIGIAIIVIGVAIGAKYAIDKQMLGPVARITIAYLFGFGLMGIALKLKKNYENYSAVLLSGAFAILYFVSYASYSYYFFFSQSLTFGLMLIFTVAAVYAALKYDRQIIAHFGLVGAYTIPFLLSDGSGKVLILFSYMVIINSGILYLSFKKYWKPLYYSSFTISWLILFLWLINKYDWHSQFTLAAVFTSIFFLLFYATFLVYKLIKHEKFNISDIFLLLLNAFIFYGLSYSLLHDFDIGKKYLGLFTLGNALAHAAISLIIYRERTVDKNLFYFVLGLAIVFLSIAIPVQLQGKWITMLWAAEAALLFWIARSKQVSLYEKLALPLAFLAFFSLLHDWTQVYNQFSVDLPETYLRLLGNINFFISLFVAAALGFISYLNKFPTTIKASKKTPIWLFKHSSTLMFIIVLYFAFWLEISNYWDQLFESTRVLSSVSSEAYKTYIYNYNLDKFKDIWLYNFSLLFFALFSLLNYMKFKKKSLAQIALLANGLLLFSFLTQGILTLKELTELYVNPLSQTTFVPTINYLTLRYISFVFVFGLIISSYYNIKSKFMQAEIRLYNTYHIVLHVVVLWLLSSELLNLTTIFHFQHADKLILSIIWGIYSVFLIVLGIKQNKKGLRVLAIVIFGITLIKLFGYDISHLNMLSKTIVFVLLGILLLVISFLYTKYKGLIFKEEEEKKNMKKT